MGVRVQVDTGGCSAWAQVTADNQVCNVKICVYIGMSPPSPSLSPSLSPPLRLWMSLWR